MLFRSSGPSQLRTIAGVWLLMLRRRWRQESAIGMVALAFVGFLIVLLRAGDVSNPAVFTTFLLVALGNAIVVTLSIGGESLAAARRLSLLPLAPGVRFVVRVLFGTPLRVALFALVLAWSAYHLIAVGLPIARIALELAQASLVVVAGVMLSVVLSEPVAFAWFRAARGTFVMLNAVVTIGAFATRRMWELDGRIAGELRDPIAALEIGGRASAGWEGAVTILYAVIAVALGAAAFQWSAATPAMPSGAGGGSSRVSQAVSALPPRLRKEMLLLLRMVAIRPLIALTLGVSLLSFGVGMPWFLVALPMLWFGFFLNGLGADLPAGGIVRYHVAAIELHRVLAWRHVAVLLMVTACVALSVIIVVVTVGIAAPVSGASRWSYLALFAYSAATLLVAAVPASRVAVRYPLPRKRLAWASGPDSAGPAALMLWVIAAGAVAVACAMGAFVLSGIALRAVAPALSTGLVSNAVVAAAVAAAGYTLAIRRGWHAPE